MPQLSHLWFELSLYLSRHYNNMGVSLVAQMVKKNLPAMRDTWVQSLGWEDPLEDGMVAHSSILV